MFNSASFGVATNFESRVCKLGGLVCQLRQLGSRYPIRHVDADENEMLSSTMGTEVNTDLPAPSIRRFTSDKYGSKEFARAQEIAHARLYPSIFASNYLVLTNRRIFMQQLFSRS